MDESSVASEREPKSSRPDMMAGYGVPESLEDSLPWEWARERIAKSHNYWFTTVRPNCSPHTMVVWGVWLNGAYYFSTSATSRKGRNLAKNPSCIVCTENADEAVIIEGVASKLNDDAIPPQAFTDYKAKYAWELDPKIGPVYEVRPGRCSRYQRNCFPKVLHAGSLNDAHHLVKKRAGASVGLKDRVTSFLEACQRCPYFFVPVARWAIIFSCLPS